MKKIILLISLFLINFDVSAGPLTFFSQNLSEIGQNCNRVTETTVALGETVATELSVSSSSIRFIRARTTHDGTCCVVLDTPKGPKQVFVHALFQGDSGELYAHAASTSGSGAICGY
jgi:hypothetical protein